MLYEIIYTSISSSDLKEEDVADILDRARKNNSEREITGMLVYRNGQFAQIIEGKKEDLNYLYHELIFKDDRHHNLTIVHEGEKNERDFGKWSMAYASLDNQICKRLNDDEDLIKLSSDQTDFTRMTLKDIFRDGSVSKKVFSEIAFGL